MNNTKRKAFENVVKQGIFSFDLNGKVHEISETEEIPQDVLEMVWRNQKLTAIDNPFVTILMLKPICSQHPNANGLFLPIPFYVS
ncbi:hypothetical protein [Peribacillus butanolivorans]|uniref:hypothetical protein n=1 Tax=Peribacillus butanolivorans TaxID=421767 RepID=UPI003662A222